MDTRIFVMIVGLTLLAGSTLWAQFQDPEHQGHTTVSSAKEAADDSWVSLTGSIIRRVDGERYLFRDATGEIVVEIDDDDWGQVTASPDTVLRITGEVDRDWWTTEIEVKTIEKVNPSLKPSANRMKKGRLSAAQDKEPSTKKTYWVLRAFH